MKTLDNSIIRLRSLEINDLDFLYEIENNIEFWEISNTVSPYSKHVLKDFINNAHKDIFTTKQERFVIENIKEKKIVGLIDLFDYEPIHLRAGIGIVIKEQNRKKSYASNALNILIGYCFNILRLNQIYCDISKDNLASINLFKKAGFKLTGEKKKWINSSSGFKDVLFYQLINE